MLENHDNFQTLMEKVIAGSSGAAQQLLQEYQPFLHRAVRRALNRKLRPKFDSLDFVQDVWCSFFAALPQQLRFDRPDELVAFLSRVAQNKVIDAVRQGLSSMKHNVTREKSLETLLGRKWEQVLAAPQLTPSEIVMGAEQWDAVLQRQPLVYRHILILLREGLTPAAIAVKIGMCEKTVRRVGEKLIAELIQ